MVWVAIALGWASLALLFALGVGAMLRRIDGGSNDESYR